MVTLGSGKLRDVTPGTGQAPPFSLGGPRPYDIAPDGREIAYEVKPDVNAASTTNNNIWLLRLDDPDAKPVNITAANDAFDGSPRYSPDGRYIAYRRQSQPGYESDLFTLAVYDRTTRSSRVISEQF